MSLRLVSVITLAAVLLLPASTAVAGGETETTLRISISPINGDPGTDISVTGEGAKAELPVKVMIVTNGDTGEGAIAEVEADSTSLRSI